MSTNCKAPRQVRTTYGKKTYCWRICPYSLNDPTDRIPIGEKAAHTVTSGRMTLDIRGGHQGMGWTCLDDACPFYLGTATTPIQIAVRRTVVSGSEYSVEEEFFETPMCSGTRFWES